MGGGVTFVTDAPFRYGIEGLKMLVLKVLGWWCLTSIAFCTLYVVARVQMRRRAAYVAVAAGAMAGNLRADWPATPARRTGRRTHVT